MKNLATFIVAGIFLASCTGGNKQAQTETKNMFTGAKGEVKIMTLDPGHFHAALVQKSMYEMVDSTVYVYAPEGDDLQGHLARINNYNTRAEIPTAWNEIVYTGPDFFEKMIAETETKGDTRQSIRLYYLWLLRTLKEKKHIEWNQQKTNADYHNEIKSEAVKEKFSYLSYLYNYIWYGEFSITDTDYVNAKKAFLTYLKQNGKNG